MRFNLWWFFGIPLGLCIVINGSLLARAVYSIDNFHAVCGNEADRQCAVINGACLCPVRHYETKGE
jgi:hypothetical protein